MGRSGSGDYRVLSDSSARHAQSGRVGSSASGTGPDPPPRHKSTGAAAVREGRETPTSDHLSHTMQLIVCRAARGAALGHVGGECGGGRCRDVTLYMENVRPL